MSDTPVYALTARQMQAMQVIQELTDANGGVPPCYDELAAELEIAGRSGINRLIKALEARGHLTRKPGHARSLTIRHRIPMPDFTPLTWLPGPELRGQGEVAHG